MKDSSERIKSASRYYYLRDDGLLFRIKRRGLSGPALAFGLLTGGFLIPVMEWNQPRNRTDLLTEPDAVEVSAGANHACYRKADGRVFCFGNNDDGQVKTFPDAAWLAAKRAIEVDLGEPALQLSSGDFYTCALLESGQVRCWGGWGYSLIRPSESYPDWATIDWSR